MMTAYKCPEDLFADWDAWNCPDDVDFDAAEWKGRAFAAPAAVVPAGLDVDPDATLEGEAHFPPLEAS